MKEFSEKTLKRMNDQEKKQTEVCIQSLLDLFELNKIAPTIAVTAMMKVLAACCKREGYSLPKFLKVVEMFCLKEWED